MSFLDWIKVFEVLTSEEKEQLENFCQEREIQKWEVLFNERCRRNWYIVKVNVEWKKRNLKKSGKFLSYSEA